MKRNKKVGLKEEIDLKKKIELNRIINYFASIDSFKKGKKLNKIFGFKRNRDLFLNKKSYLILKKYYKRFLFNKFSRKLIRRTIFYVQIKILRKIKQKKEKNKRIILLQSLYYVIYKIRIKLLLRNLSFF